MAMTLRLADDETEALRRRAELEHRSMQEVARQAIREYVENHSRVELLDQVLDEELPRYAEALERLGLAAVIAFYGLNGRRLTLTNDEAYELVMSVAAGQFDTVDAIAAVLQGATQPRR